MLLYTTLSFLDLVRLHALADVPMRMVSYNPAPDSLHMRTGDSVVPDMCTASVGGFKSLE
jgi:hypothetical protein